MRERDPGVTLVKIVILALIVGTLLACALAWVFRPSGVSAQSSLCDQSVVITAAAAASATVAPAVDGRTIYVCGYNLTGNTAATGIQFQTGTTNLTGVMLTGQYGNLSYGNGGAIILRGNYGATVTVAATTGAVTGVVTFGQY